MPLNEVPSARIGLLSLSAGALLILTAMVAVVLTRQFSFGVLSSLGVGVVLLSQGAFQIRVLRHVA